ncbi:hypothetical protein E4U53_006922 [Claviceps sorghi]|nr:hypothetical protein E4U53_006922 [Claviceps sorghi]
MPPSPVSRRSPLLQEDLQEPAAKVASTNLSAPTPLLSWDQDDLVAGVAGASCSFEPLILSLTSTGQPGCNMSLNAIISVVAGRRGSSGDSLCLKLSVLLASELAILITLSFRMTVEADVRTNFSLRIRVETPGKGKISRLQTSASSVSNRARSILGGDRTDTRDFVDNSDCERLMLSEVVLLT